jgi:hypothetical protein
MRKRKDEDVNFQYFLFPPTLLDPPLTLISVELS